ncbi:MAG TPA: hypothetical protein VMT20_02555 [Terriglobia bacterium]|nr:hypothetical protein [Terriglobia bacterium]
MTVVMAMSGLAAVFPTCQAQETVPQAPAKKTDQQINVNWLYGSYVPKEVPLRSLTNHERVKLYVRQSFTTPGIYVKTALFSIGDQIDNSPPEWGSGFAGFGRRFASRQGQFVVQNSFSSLGNAMLGYEPRYDRCRCSGFWRRTGHALLRDFFTYNRTEKELRPQIPLFVAAFGAGVVAGTWKPNNDLVGEGYRSVITQAGFGFLANWVGEFAPDAKRILRKNKGGGTSAGKN